MPKTVKSIRSIAKDTREWAEEISVQYEDSDEEHLSCLCAITSFEIFTFLLSYGFKPEFVHNRCHCFVEVNGYIVDITASQFNSKLPKIIVRKRKNLPARDREIWEPLFRCTTPKQIKKSLHDWPDEQQPIPIQKRYI